MTGHCAKSPELTYGLDFTQKEIDDAIKNKRLLSLDLETSLACNLRCIYCYSSAGEKRSNELNTKAICDVVDQAVELGVRVISVIGGGEPLMYKDIIKILTHIATKPVRRILFTNGTLITKEIAQFLKDNKFSVVIKFNSMISDIQDTLAGIPGTYEKIHKGMQHLFDAGYPSADLPLGIETIICKQNINELPQIWEWARQRNIIPYFETVTFMGRARNHDLNVAANDIETLFKSLLEIDKNKYNLTWNMHPPIAGLSCKRHYYNLVVTSNGYVRPCVGVNISLGNIRHTSLKDIIESSVILDSLRNMRKNIKGHCKICQFSNECYGCRGMAYHVYGDCFESDPFCWKNPKRIDQTNI